MVVNASMPFGAIKDISMQGDFSLVAYMITPIG